MQPSVPTTIALILSVCIIGLVLGAAGARLETGPTADREGAANPNRERGRAKGFSHQREPNHEREEAAKRIAAAVPSSPYAKPQGQRKLLVFTLTRGYRHSVIPLATEALKILGEKSGAYEAVASEDIAMFEPEALARFDAVCLLNNTGELFLPQNLDKLTPAERAEAEGRDADLKRSLLDFVAGGKGLIGIHAATDCFYDWAQYGELMGGYFDGHPWNEEVFIKVDEPAHPLNAPFAGQTLVVADEIYQFRAPYSRKNLHVLLSLDTGRTDMSKRGIKRTDDDFAVSWVRTYGKGRVFYCSLGHRDEIFFNPKVLRHYLAGIQFAMGDLPADPNRDGGREKGISNQRANTSSDPNRDSEGVVEFIFCPSGAGWTPLFNGQDLTGWKGLVADPKTRATMDPATLAKAQATADKKMRTHWQVKDGLLTFDGKGDNICTAEDYGDFELAVDWKIEPGGDSGIYLRGSPQVQIWDPAQWPEGSGGLYNNQHNPSKPLIRADNPVGEWNTFRIKMIGPRVTVRLNDALVVDDVRLENYWQPDGPIYPTGQIELQAHGGPLAFRSIFIREIPAEKAVGRVRKSDTGSQLVGRVRRPDTGSQWRELFNGQDLTGWKCKPGTWSVNEGVLTRKGGGDIWSEGQFGDFILELEFMLDEGTNSGVFFRTADINDCVQTGIEMQVLDSYGKAEVGKHDCGAIYDCLAPSKNVVRKPGEWNHAVLTCTGSKVTVVMNGERIIDMDLDRWNTPHSNPDGSPNKFDTAYKSMPRAGYIGFQDHGKPIRYRNIRIKPLPTATVRE